MISIIFWLIVGIGAGIFLFYIGSSLLQIISGIGEICLGDNGAFIIWLIIILGGAALLFLQLMDRKRRSQIIERRDKRLFRLYRRYGQIDKEMRKKYRLSPVCLTYSHKDIENIDDFLRLRDEAHKIDTIIYGKEYNRCVKYVKGGRTFFYTPMKKKDRRKALRKFRLLQLGYYLAIYEESKVLGTC